MESHTGHLNSNKCFKQPHTFMALETAECKEHSKARKVLNRRYRQPFHSCKAKAKLTCCTALNHWPSRSYFYEAAMKIPLHMHVNDGSHWDIFLNVLASLAHLIKPNAGNSSIQNKILSFHGSCGVLRERQKKC